MTDVLAGLASAAFAGSPIPTAPDSFASSSVAHARLAEEFARGLWRRGALL